MSKYTIAGLVSWLFSGLILLFQAISSFMGMEEKMVFKSLTLMDVVGPGHFLWIDGISWVSIQTTVHYIVTMPLFLLLIFVRIFIE